MESTSHSLTPSTSSSRESRASSPKAAEFSGETDSLAEEEGFEPSVPRKRDNGFRDCPVRPLRRLPFRERDRVVLERDRGFESLPSAKRTPGHDLPRSYCVCGRRRILAPQSALKLLA